MVALSPPIKYTMIDVLAIFAHDHDQFIIGGRVISLYSIGYIFLRSAFSTSLITVIDHIYNHGYFII